MAVANTSTPALSPVAGRPGQGPGNPPTITPVSRARHDIMVKAAVHRTFWAWVDAHRVTIRTLARKTGLSRVTLSRMRKRNGWSWPATVTVSLATAAGLDWRALFDSIDAVPPARERTAHIGSSVGWADLRYEQNPAYWGEHHEQYTRRYKYRMTKDRGRLA